MKQTRRRTRRNKQRRCTRHCTPHTLQISRKGENGSQERTFLENHAHSLERIKAKRPRQRSIRPTGPSYKVRQRRHVGRVQDYQTKAGTDSSHWATPSLRETLDPNGRYPMKKTAPPHRGRDAQRGWGEYLQSTQLNSKARRKRLMRYCWGKGQMDGGR